MSVKERVKIFAKSQNITIIAFEKSIKASNGYVNSISKSIGLDKIELILENFPNLNIEWLLTGKGEMLKTKGNVHQNIDNNKADNNLNNNISGTNIKGDVVVSHNDISKLIELQKGSQEIQKELNKRLEASQNQIDTLLEILKNK